MVGLVLLSRLHTNLRTRSGGGLIDQWQQWTDAKGCTCTAVNTHRPQRQYVAHASPYAHHKGVCVCVFRGPEHVTSTNGEQPQIARAVEGRRMLSAVCDCAYVSMCGFRCVVLDWTSLSCSRCPSPFLSPSPHHTVVYRVWHSK